jgi:glutamate synthase (ferredoxin)
LDTIALEAEMRHRQAYPTRPMTAQYLQSGGDYQWRQDGEYHLFNPQTIHKLQKAVRNNSYATFKEYSELLNAETAQKGTLRGLFEFKIPARSVPLEEVEPVEAIVRRFKTGAMSYGSISKEAHEALAIAMNRIGGKSNSGEGGEDPERYIPLPKALKKSAIKQVASARLGDQRVFGQCRELQIKMAREPNRRADNCPAQGLSADCQSALLHARRGIDLASAASRYLFD